MHFCTAMVAIAEDAGNIAAMNEYQPISWPEVFLIQQLHGPASVTDVVPFAFVPQSSQQERARLALKYGEAIVAYTYGGRQGPAEMDAPGVTIKDGVKWLNPITRKVEITGEDPAFRPLERIAAEEDDIFSGVAGAPKPRRK